MGFEMTKHFEVSYVNEFHSFDLFCGIGGFQLAMNSSQVKYVSHLFAQQTYEANFQESPMGEYK